MIYTDCLRLVEMIDFDIKIVQIRVRMQKLEQSECSPVTRRNMARPTRRHVWLVARVKRSFARAIWPSRWPLIKKRSTWKLFVSSKQLRLLLNSLPSKIVYHHKKDTQDTASLNRTVLESSDKTNPYLTRVLDVNPSLFLAREVQPPLIYLRGDGRLKQHQSNQSIYYTFVFIYFYLSPCIFLLVLHRFKIGGCESMRL